MIIKNDTCSYIYIADLSISGDVKGTYYSNGKNDQYPVCPAAFRHLKHWLKILSHRLVKCCSINRYTQNKKS